MWGELSSECGASCLGASFLWDELSLGRVVLIPFLSFSISSSLENILSANEWMLVH